MDQEKTTNETVKCEICFAKADAYLYTQSRDIPYCAHHFMIAHYALKSEARIIGRSKPDQDATMAVTINDARLVELKAGGKS